ncbi:ATP-dependent RNA helicase DDX24-like [Pocillopora verrucosa]|uniref:ATP-dependent RNA helicase DDX24-like n=1 Tax=Pocillopora verrucosa TaxID=203993 RepID=UPI0033423BF9
MDGFVFLEVMEDYHPEELAGISAGGPAQKKKIKERPLQEDNLEQTVTTPSTQLEKSTKNDQQTKGKKKRKKKNKAQSKAQSEEQNRVEMVTDNRLVEDPPEATETGNGTSKLKKPLLALIMTPTRELVIQIKNHLKQAAKHTSLEIVAVVGGMAPQKQQRLLNKCPEIIVATPGRLWDLISEVRLRACRLEHLRYLVIDEADRMVEQGHFQELSSILELIQRKRQWTSISIGASISFSLLFLKLMVFMTITNEEGFVSLMDKVGLQKNSCKIIDVTNKRGTVETLTEAKISCVIEEKDLYLHYFLSRYPGRTLVFSKTVDCVRRLGSLSRILDFNPWVLHASMQQRQRLKNLDRFKQSASGLLLATDVAARGLDIPAVEHVIHYQVPKDLDLYIHRSGRTARASREGLSVVLVGPEEMGSYKKIMKALNGGG